MLQTPQPHLSTVEPHVSDSIKAAADTQNSVQRGVVHVDGETSKAASTGETPAG